MRNKMFACIAILFLALAAVVVFNLRDDTSFDAQPAPSLSGVPKLIIIGNSITLHGPKPAIQWAGNHGMAASSPSHDYAHLLINHLGIPSNEAYIRNFYPFETNSAGAKANLASIAAIFKLHPSVTVLQLGDNVKAYKLRDLYYFRENYQALSKMAAGTSERVYCLSTFWRSRIVDWVIESVCKNVGGTYVYIGDIYSAPNNPDRQSTAFANSGVNRHPQDYSMQQIADRLGLEIGRVAD